MSYSGPARTAAVGPRSLASSASPVPPATGVTVYGCARDEEALFRDLAPRFGVLPTIVAAAVFEANIQMASGNQCISVGHKTPITNRTLLALSEVGVKYLSTRSVGFNHIDVGYAESVGISVGNVEYSPHSVADYTLMLMLMALRHVKSVMRSVDASDYRLTDARGRELRDLTVGIIGTGRIGSAVMDRLWGFGCRVLAYDNDPRTSARYVPLDELVQQSDIVTLHTPLTAYTHHLLNRERIALMKRGAVVVNTGRGPLIDTEALVAALESGRLGGAALDVVEGEEGVFYTDRRNEPIESEALVRLQQLPNALISPHIAYYTDHALRDTVENSLINCRNFEAGRRRG